MSRNDEIRLRRTMEAARVAESFGLFRPYPDIPLAEEGRPAANRAKGCVADTRAAEKRAPS